MIRQAISCDICGTEKRQTNHWFVAYEQGGELRVSGWSSRHRLRPGSEHLCGQTCLHKLVDEFVAKSNAARGLHTEEEPEAKLHRESLPPVDTSLTSSAAYGDVDSSARLPTARDTIANRPSLSPAPKSVTMPLNTEALDLSAVSVEAPRYTQRNRRAAAWERERERELGTAENHTAIAAHRRPHA